MIVIVSAMFAWNIPEPVQKSLQKWLILIFEFISNQIHVSPK